MASGAQALTLDIVGGQWMGASDVKVDLLYFAVEFIDGTCIDLFIGCDDASDFTFWDIASAELAMMALLEHVLEHRKFKLPFPWVR